MEVSVFGDSACVVQDGQLFIAEKEEVEGRPKAILNQVKSADTRSKEEKVREIIYFIKDDFAEMPEQMISGILELVQNFDKYLPCCEKCGARLDRGQIGYNTLFEKPNQCSLCQAGPMVQEQKTN